MSTIFAPITAFGKSGVSVIRISGNNALKCLKYLGVNQNLQARFSYLCKLINPHDQKIIDQSLIVFFPAPNSFTGEDVAEISIHSSPYIMQIIFKLLLEVENTRFAEAGEFSKIAFLNGKMDLTEAEAIVDLIAAETEAQHRQALNQMQGFLSEIYENWCQELINITANIEAYIDFPDQDLPEDIINNLESRVSDLEGEIKNHLNDNQRGEKIRDGLKLAIIGAPNVGKSSLINYLSKTETAIVSEIPGTTRDLIQTHLSISGIPVIISDSAGIRETEDQIEKIGIQKALLNANLADLKLLVLDVNNLKNIGAKTLELLDENTLIIINKIDLKEVYIPEELKIYPHILISLKEKINLENFLEILENKVKEIASPGSMPLITRVRYREALSTALENLSEFSLKKNVELAAEDLRLAIRAIGKITGKVAVDDILDVIFAGFCIGK